MSILGSLSASPLTLLMASWLGGTKNPMVLWRANSIALLPVLFDILEHCFSVPPGPLENMADSPALTKELPTVYWYQVWNSGILVHVLVNRYHFVISKTRQFQMQGCVFFCPSLMIRREPMMFCHSEPPLCHPARESLVIVSVVPENLGTLWLEEDQVLFIKQRQRALASCSVLINGL